MTQSAPITGTISDKTLTYRQDGHEITMLIDSPAWFIWLDRATSFTFWSEEGHFTAHKTHAGNRRGGSYWRATRRSRGRLSSFYLGSSPKLTFNRLQEAAHFLMTRASSPPPIPPPKKLSYADPLLITRLSIPRLPIQHVSRPRLLISLEQSVQRPVTLISAPAGSGKTTLLAEWARTTAFPTTWLSCEEADNDPARFFSYLIAALIQLLAPTDAIENNEGVSPYSGPWEHALIHLLNHLTCSLQQDAIVILDDAHLLTSDAVQTILRFLLDHLPPCLHLVIGTRVDPSWPLARLRAHNQLSELRTEALRFVSGEVATFVQAMELPLSAEALHLLTDHTEGWIAGIQLLTLALRGRTDTAAFLHTVDGSHRFLLEYVSEEILGRQMVETQRFLLQTSVLERITGPLSDALTSQTNGRVQLEELRRANLFVSELDDARGWYRYHPLFAEVLRAHLEAQEPDLIPQLYLRASYWFEQAQAREEACQYAFLAGDQTRSAILLAQLMPDLLAQGKILRLSQWLAQLSPAAIASSPWLSLASLWTQTLTRKTPEDAEQLIQTLLERLEPLIQTHKLETESSWPTLQHIRPYLQTMTALIRDDLETAQRIMVQEAALAFPEGLARAPGDLLTSQSLPGPLATLGLIEQYEFNGHLHKLGEFYQKLFRTLPHRQDFSPLFQTLVLIRHATLLYEWNQLAEVEAVIARAREAGQHLELPTPMLAWVEARLALAQGDDEKACTLLDRLEFENAQLQIPQQTKIVLGTLSARLALACGQFARAERWEESCGLSFDDPLGSTIASNDYIPYVLLARISLARGHRQRADQALTQGLILLNNLLRVVTEMGADGWRIEVQMLIALALQAQGKVRQAIAALSAALNRAEPEGYLRLFADEGEPMAHLLALIPSQTTTVSTRYVQRLQTALFVHPFTARSEGTSEIVMGAARLPELDPLSEREREVLSLLADGLSNQQIAWQLVISLHTVKLHVKHILAKLAVTNRTQAVARARALHLL
jgi:LuxR family maltose regulon positive regulatory protein